jgi:hypothetical protein
MKGRLAQIDADRMYLHVAESMCPVQPLLQEHVIVSLVRDCYSHTVAWS